MELTGYIIIFLAALGAGFVNAIAGGGTLISFPVLVALGIPPVAGNITNTIALCPGYFGGTWAQRKDIREQKNNLRQIIPAAILGGITGGVLLLITPENSFNVLVPYLILTATLILAVQQPLKNYLNKKRKSKMENIRSTVLTFIFVFLAALYGGYFGAGLGVILMAVFGLILNETITKLNALKQATSFCINISAAIYFSFSKLTIWPIVIVMVAGSLAGGILGGNVAGKINPQFLRWAIIIIGFSVAIIYFIKS